MAKEKMLQSEISSYLSNLFREHFGKGPTSVYVTLAEAFITIHFRGFLSPMEKVLVNRNEHQRILETRDLMMNDIQPELMFGLSKYLKKDIIELYADWNLENETGLILGVLEVDADESASPFPPGIDIEAFREKVNTASKKAEKTPGDTEIYWLSDRTILARRADILVQIEKELIKNGFEEPLKLAKRPLELRVMREAGLEAVVKRSINEIFLAWNFNEDLGYVVFLLEAQKYA